MATGLRLNPPCSFAQTAIRTFAKLSSKLNFRRPAIGHRCWSPPVFSVLSSSPLPAFQRADRTRYRGRSTDPRRRGTPGLSTVVAFCETLARRRGFPALYGLQNGFPGHSCPIRWGRRHSRIGRARALVSPAPQCAAQPVSFSHARPLSRGARSMPRVFGRGSRSQPAALVSDRDDAALFPAIRIVARYGSAKSGRAPRVRTACRPCADPRCSSRTYD